jgi:hypothetical protein
MIDLLIKYPTRERPEIFKKLINQYISNLSGKRKVKFIISLDSDDASCNNSHFIFFLNELKKKVNLEFYFDKSNNKIHACNRDIPDDGWKVCVLVSDDMVPKKHSFDDIIMNDMEKYYPNLDGAINYNAYTTAFEQHIPGRGSLMVLSIMGKTYYDRFKFIYNPIYKSLFADDEQTRIARKLNKITDINNRIIAHEWSSINDNLRKKTEALDSEDRQIFKTRLKEGLI